MLTLIRGGEIYAPEPLGTSDLLAAGGRVLKIGTIDGASLSDLGLEVEVVDASGCLVVPGLVDPHQHLIGAGGEQGFSSRMPEVAWEEIARAGISCVVGCLGTDTTTRHLTSLLAKARQLRGRGISAYLYTGGFPVPAPTLTGSITSDLVIVPEVIGAGEIAISDHRSSQPSLQELARLVSEAIVGGMVGGKAGVVHFHVGSGRARLRLLRELLDDHEIPPAHLYPTHIGRDAGLMDEAISLARRGCYVDLDTVEEDLGRWAGYYRDGGGPVQRLTASSDAHTPGGTPEKLLRSLVSLVRDAGWAMEELLPVFTSNPAAALGLKGKGRLQEGGEADILLLERGSLDVVHLFAGGERLMRDGQPEVMR